MDGHVGRCVDVAERVLVYMHANRSTDPGNQAAETKLEIGLVAVKEHGRRQSDGQLSGRAIRANRRALRRAIEQEYVPHLVSVALLAAKTDAGRFGSLTRPAVRGAGRKFGLRVRSMLDTAKAAVDVLKPLGLSDTLLPDLESALLQYEELSQAASETRSVHVAATQSLAHSCRELRESIRVLDGIYRYRFRNDPARLAQWVNVRAMAGLGRTKPEAPPPVVEGGGSQ